MDLPETPSHELVQAQLEKILLCDGFARNERQSRFLRFVVEGRLAGRVAELKESLIAIEVFGRAPGYDPRQDSVVRTEASRLRTRLTEYYAGEGRQDGLIIELPKGGYVPSFRQTGENRSSAVPAPPRQSRRWLLAGIAGIVAVIAALSAWSLRGRNEPIPIAVLPLINVSQDPANEYFSDGLTGEIIRNLSIIDGLVVRSQTSSFVFKGKSQNILDTGKELKADYILEGSVLRDGQRLRIDAQLVRVRDDFPLWSARYDREMTDVFTIQDEISRGIVNSLRLKLGQGRRRYETSTEAYDLYLRARALETASSAKGRNYSVGYYEQAIAKDPSFAPAFAGLGAAYAYRTGEDRLNSWAVLDRSEELKRMHVVVQKALTLDPLLAEAHVALGMSQSRDGEWGQSEKSFRRALELEPNRASTRTDFALFLLIPLGRIEEAVAQVRLAEKSDPSSPTVQSAMSYVLFSAGKYEEAAAHCEKPCARALILTGRAAEAIPALEERFKGQLSAPSSGQLLGYAYAVVGRTEDAERVASLQPRPIDQATIFTGLGDKDRAFEALDRAVPMGAVRVGRVLTWPEFAPLRNDPRMKILRRKAGLPE